jgi:hypothetical protein
LLLTTTTGSIGLVVFPNASMRMVLSEIVPGETNSATVISVTETISNFVPSFSRFISRSVSDPSTFISANATGAVYTEARINGPSAIIDVSSPTRLFLSSGKLNFKNSVMGYFVISSLVAILMVTAL